jgi:uncharacterized membrane protein
MIPDAIQSAPAIVQFHLAAAVPAVVLGPFALLRRRRDRLHRILGYGWIGSILALALSSLWIRSDHPLIGPFGLIHLLSFSAIWGVLDGLRLIRRGDVRGHLVAMQSVWFGAVGGALLLALLPGRTLNRVVFPDDPGLGFAALALGLVILAWLWTKRFRAGPPAGGKMPLEVDRRFD